jgi:hypothetical protein
VGHFVLLGRGHQHQNMFCSISSSVVAGGIISVVVSASAPFSFPSISLPVLFFLERENGVCLCALFKWADIFARPPTVEFLSPAARITSQPSPHPRGCSCRRVALPLPYHRDPPVLSARPPSLGDSPPAATSWRRYSMIDSFSAPPSPPSVTERGGPRVYASRDSSLRGIALNLPLRLFRSFDGIPPVLCSSFACGTALHHLILLSVI